MAILRRAQDRSELRRGTISRRAVLKAFAGTGTAAIAATGAYGLAYVVPVSTLPTALAGLRIGLLTDVHRSQWVSDEDVARAVGALMAEQPDVIVLGGDYVTWGDRRYVGPSADALDPCRRRSASTASSAITTTITICRRR